MERLDKSIFTQDGFECRFNEDEFTFFIKFLDDDRYYFKVEEKSDTLWYVFERPGDTFADEQTSRCDTFDEAVEKIDNWLQQTLEELKASSAENPNVFEALRDRLNQQADALPDPNVHLAGPRPQHGKSDWTI